jgi:hypothetical protein
MTTHEELRLEDLLGREVLSGNNHRVGRIEEFHADWRGGRCTIGGFVIGAAGLYERLGIGLRRIVGLRRRRGRVARWDQMDLSNPKRPRLTCPVEELERM